jgi:DNA-binding response OmpR family regulator
MLCQLSQIPVRKQLQLFRTLLCPLNSSTFGTFTPPRTLIPYKWKILHESSFEMNEETAMIPQETVLVIDDDRTLLRLVNEALIKAKFRVILASNGIDGLQELYARQPDLVILDVMMPRMDGWETLSRIRQVSRVPVIMLTAKDAEQDRLRGFQLGVDDYVTKPFSLAELAARAHAVIHRTQQAAPSQKTERYVSGDLVIDVETHRITKHGERVELTPTEFRLLQVLAENAGRVLTQEQLLERVWGYDTGEDAGYIKRYIWYLRHKVEDDPTNPQHILTERGFGYSFQGT